ncbi:MAG: GDP-mannose 4,6-dehydratase [Candidatus Anoxymicrobium japonicum]|uniref:GDP-mannose 4,6-dehydratase n=1 Tax=Candidatus Anoxymicrobium japonicum TaxID=2013648 RepID=A0A2N3G5S6_9ACTN|nr:MAG: GDP-mannose 4,6-dehydratase [Candidatus Anoxymicrobium japonicum]
MERVLITGADGFVASHLIEELARERGCEIIGIGLKEAPSVNANLLDYMVMDITECEQVLHLLDEKRPDSIFHLAAVPSVALSWEDPWATYKVNVLGQVNLMEAARKLGLEPSVLITCSSEEYGKVSPEEMPIVESAPLNPCSHYAVSKVAQEALGFMYHEAFTWRVLVTRGFNQCGPRQSSNFVVSSFARQIAEIEVGAREPVLMAGNLEAKRDFMDVRDTVRAYRAIMEKGNAGAAYNVCSGRARPASQVLEMLLDISGAEIEVRRDPSRRRPSDIPVLLGDNTRLRKETGWEPAIEFETTLEDTLDYWRNRVQKGV